LVFVFSGKKGQLLMKLQNKVAVTTGGNSGIGLATAREFKTNGAKVVIFGRMFFVTKTYLTMHRHPYPPENILYCARPSTILLG
jgi:hypothetical protein